MLFAKDISLRLGERHLFNQLSFSLLEGDRIAFVGHNGAGKSTFLKILAREMEPDSGKIEIRSGIQIGILSQEPHLQPYHTVEESVQLAIKPWLEAIQRHTHICQLLEKDTTSLELQQQLSQLSHDIEVFGGFDVNYRLEKVLSILGIKSRKEKIDNLSGGERRRVDLARLLLSAPDIFLLDEPTNHLDVKAIQFLEDFFKASPKPVLFISHDRNFIDKVATKIVELEQGALFTHPIPYEQFIESKLTRLEINEKTAHRRERLMARELAWLRAGTPARTTKQKARMERAENLIEQVGKDITANQERILKIQQAKSSRLAKTILELKEVGYRIGERQLFSGVNLLVVEGERFGIVGPNGVGKTTLLKVITGALSPTSGEVTIGPHTHFALFDQNRALLNPHATLMETLADHGDTVFVGEEKVHIASYLERFLFDPYDRFRQVSTLSGGEQNRLLLAKMFKTSANCLVLDEPTNDLDLTSLAVLEQILQEQKGVAFIVSHDRTFLDRVCTGIIAFEPNGQVVVYQGNYSTYERLRPTENEVNEKPLAKASDKNQGEKKKRKRSYKEEKEYAEIEERLFQKEQEKEDVEKSLSDGSLYQNDRQRAQQIMERMGVLEKEIDQLYQRWQELEELG